MESKLLKFIVIGLGVLIIQTIIISLLEQNIPEEGSFFTLPWNNMLFISGAVALSLAVVFYIFFPEISKGRKL